MHSKVHSNYMLSISHQSSEISALKRCHCHSCGKTVWLIAKAFEALAFWRGLRYVQSGSAYQHTRFWRLESAVAASVERRLKFHYERSTTRR